MKNQKNSTMLKTIIFWGAIAAITAGILSMLSAFLIVKEVIPQFLAEYLTPVIALISVFISGLFAARSQEDKKLLVTMGTAAVYFVICLLAKLAFFPGSTVFMLRNAIITLIAALMAALVSGLKKSKRKYGTARHR